MYINLDYKDLTEEIIKKLDEGGYKLCYVDYDKDEYYNECYRTKYELYFTPISLKEQWADDWDDAPYECNAGLPYDDVYTDDGEKIEYTIYSVNIVIDVDKVYITLPADYGYNSMFSVKMINEKAVAWIYGTEVEDKWNTFTILAGDKASEIFDKLKKYIKPYETDN